MEVNLENKDEEIIPVPNIEQEDDSPIGLEELKEMNQTIISEYNRLTKKAQSFFKRVKEGEKIPKEEQKQLDDEWKQLRKMESSYKFIVQKSKQAGMKIKDIEAESGGPDIEKIKSKTSSLGAIITMVPVKKAK